MSNNNYPFQQTYQIPDIMLMHYTNYSVIVTEQGVLVFYGGPHAIDAKAVADDMSRWTGRFSYSADFAQQKDERIREALEALVNHDHVTIMLNQDEG